MSVAIAIRDETTGGKVLHEWSLDVLTERITVRELIRSRVYQEVQDYNLRLPDVFHGLVQPADSNQTPAGYRLRQRRQIDWRPQFEKACEAFESNQIVILVNDKQVDSLDEEIELSPGTQVSFLRLALLVGG
jgi:hypothetical protein